MNRQPSYLKQRLVGSLKAFRYDTVSLCYRSTLASFAKYHSLDPSRFGTTAHHSERAANCNLFPNVDMYIKLYLRLEYALDDCVYRRRDCWIEAYTRGSSYDHIDSLHSNNIEGLLSPPHSTGDGLRESVSSGGETAMFLYYIDLSSFAACVLVP